MRRSNILPNLLLTLGALFVGGLVKKFLHENVVVGIVVAAVVCISYSAIWIRGRLMPKNTRVRLQTQEMIGEHGFTELMYCSCFGDVDRAMDLLNYGAGANARTRDGRTPLFFAALNGQTDMVRLLLERGADPSIKPEKGLGPLGVAKKRGHVGVVKLISGNQE